MACDISNSAYIQVNIGYCLLPLNQPHPNQTMFWPLHFSTIKYTFENFSLLNKEKLMLNKFVVRYAYIDHVKILEVFFVCYCIISILWSSVRQLQEVKLSSISCPSVMSLLVLGSEHCTPGSLPASLQKLKIIIGCLIHIA